MRLLNSKNFFYFRYLSNKYDFQSQTDSIDKAKEICKSFIQSNIGQNYLFVCGTYTVGKYKSIKKKLKNLKEIFFF